MDSRLAHPFTCIVYGHTGNGKSVFTLKLIEHAREISSHHPNESSFVTENIKNYLITMPELIFHDGLPDLSSFDGKKRTLLVMDDLITSTDDGVVDIFTKICHDRNLSVVYLTQNLFFTKTNRLVR